MKQIPDTTEVCSQAYFRYLYFIFIIIIFFIERVSLCNSGLPGTCYVDQTGLELTETCLLGLKACIIRLGPGTSAAYLPKDGTIRSGHLPPTSTSNQENAPQTFPQGSLV